MLEQMGPEFYVIAALIAIFTFLILPIAVHVFFKIESRIHIVVLVVILVVIIILENFFLKDLEIFLLL